MDKDNKHKTHKSIDVPLFLTVICMVTFGLIMVFSSSSVMAGERYGDPFFFLKRQLMWFAFGFAAMIVAMCFDYSKLHKFSFLMILLSIILLIFVLVPGIGVSVSGARRWFRFGFIGFQPSEFAKISLLIYTSSWLDRKQSKIQKGFTIYIPQIFIIGLMLSLIYFEPDLGTVVLLFVTLTTLHFAGGLSLKYLGTLFLISLPAVYYAVFNSSYRRRRLLSFLNPWADARGGGYQIIQSLLALGSGGITGVGIGDSKLKLLYLPEAHTDFIYPIIAEECGILGSLGIISLFVYFCYRGIKISLYSRDFFGRMLAFGLTMYIMYQAIINIAVTTGMLPTKGMPLPFISFGGSSLVVTLFSVGIILNISRYQTDKKHKTVISEQ